MGRKDTPPERIVSPVGAMLRAMRTAKGVTLSEMVAKVGKSKGHLSNVENGNVMPSQDLLVAYGKELELSASEYEGLVAATRQTFPYQFRTDDPLKVDYTLDLTELAVSLPEDDRVAVKEALAMLDAPKNIENSSQTIPPAGVSHPTKVSFPLHYEPPNKAQEFSRLNKPDVWRDLVQDPSSSWWDVCDAFIDQVVQGYVADEQLADQEVTNVLSNLMLAVHTDLPSTYHGTPSLTSWLISRTAQVVAKVHRAKSEAEVMIGKLQQARESGEQYSEITEALKYFCRKQRDPARVALVLNLALHGKPIPRIAASTHTPIDSIVHVLTDVGAFLAKNGVIV